MQLYANTLDGKTLHVSEATKQVDYLCRECHKYVRLRSGQNVHPHFYHFQETHCCRQNGKTAEHLAVQQYLRSLLNCQLEVAFPSIGRIADACDARRKLIFEVQYSPISAKEVLERNYDYKTLGYNVIWLLHDRRFKQKKATSAEIALLPHPHYFTNLTAEGKGNIYDQTTAIRNGRRALLSDPYSVDLTRKKEKAGPAPKILAPRNHWPFFFGEDLLDKSTLLPPPLPKKPSFLSFICHAKNLYNDLIKSLLEKNTPH